MAISPDTPIDFAKIALEMRATVARWYNADIEILNPGTGSQEWDPLTNEFSNNPEAVVYSGKARVQPIRTTSTPDLGITQGAIRAIRVQIPYDSEIPFIPKGFEVRVVSGGEDHIIQSLQFVVRSAVNSSYGWNRTIECDVDLKSVAG